MPAAPAWTVICRVVDHFGDAGVCWRLARQLAHEHHIDVTLLIDDIATLARLAPAIDPQQHTQRVEQIIVQQLSTETPAPATWPNAIIDAFGGGLPDAWLEALARDFPSAQETNARAPHWIVLEYLSAESWVDTMHACPSPPPAMHVPRHFFFPGFTPATGGLLRENSLITERDAFQSNADARHAYLASLGIPSLPDNALLVSLFCYQNPALPALLDAWADSKQPIVCLLPEGVARQSIADWCARHHLAQAGSYLAHGALHLHTIPFVPQRDFDRLLWTCDLNFVRGEDSFVRAQWAARPFVWHAYRQAEQTHLVKLDAFLARSLAGAPPAAKTALEHFSNLWNGAPEAAGSIDTAWARLVPQLSTLATSASQWSAQQAALPNLAQRLVEFVER